MSGSNHSIDIINEGGDGDAGDAIDIGDATESTPFLMSSAKKRKSGSHKKRKNKHKNKKTSSKRHLYHEEKKSPSKRGGGLLGSGDGYNIFSELNDSVLSSTIRQDDDNLNYGTNNNNMISSTRDRDLTGHSHSRSINETPVPIFTDYNSEQKIKKNRRKINNNRCMILILLVVLVCDATYYQMKVISLNNTILEDQQHIAKIEKIISVHDEVINRFNQSVTNQDVLERLTGLETQMNDATRDLTQQLYNTKHSINLQLNQTMIALDETVQKAEQDIEFQVDKVKHDVDQYVIATEAQFSMQNSFMVFQIAGTVTLLSCLISMWHMTAHLRKLKQPVVQRKILAILWMCPIYATTSWFSLIFPKAEGYLAIIKDGYEAYIIYQFLSFCISVLGKGDRNAVVDLLAKHADHLTPPFRFDGLCNPDPYENNRQLADAVLLQCQLFAMQFVFLRPLITILQFLFFELDYFGASPDHSPHDYRAPQPYLMILQNLSVFIAFTGLLKFYHAVDKDLAWCRPFAKFLCIKGVVFMTFWQGVAISILASTTDVGGKDADEWAKSAQNFLICLEMLIFSIAHFYCFPTDEWQEGYKVKVSENKFGDTVAFGDFVEDLKLIMRSNKRHKKNRRQNKAKPPTIQEGYSEDDDETETSDYGSVTSGQTLTSINDDEVESFAKKITRSLQETDDDNTVTLEAKKRVSRQISHGDSAFRILEDDETVDEANIGERDDSISKHDEEKAKALSTIETLALEQSSIKQPSYGATAHAKNNTDAEDVTEYADDSASDSDSDSSFYPDSSSDEDEEKEKSKVTLNNANKKNVFMRMFKVKNETATTGIDNKMNPTSWIAKLVPQKKENQPASPPQKSSRPDTESKASPSAQSPSAVTFSETENASPPQHNDRNLAESRPISTNPINNSSTSTSTEDVVGPKTENGNTKIVQVYSSSWESTGEDISAKKNEQDRKDPPKNIEQSAAPSEKTITTNKENIEDEEKAIADDTTQNIASNQKNDGTKKVQSNDDNNNYNQAENEVENKDEENNVEETGPPPLNPSIFTAIAKNSAGAYKSVFDE